MMKAIRIASLMLLVAVPGGALAAGDEPEILAELSQDRVYEGESVQYTVTLNHVRNPSPPELRGFDDFKVALLGNNPQNFSSTTIINGRVTKVERFGMQYVYRLTPTRSGMLTVPAPVANAGGKALKGPRLSLSVVAPQEQDVVLMEITSEPKSVYPMQPMDITLSVFVRDLPAPYADHDPLSAQRAIQAEQPSLQIPWVVDESIPKGLKPRRKSRRWCQALQSQNGAGFSMNNLAVRDAMSVFDDSFFNMPSPFGRGSLFDDDFFGRRSAVRRGPRKLLFEPRPTRVVRKDAGGGDVGYWRYDFTRRFTPKMIGQYTFGPANLKGNFLTGVNSAGQGSVEDVYAIAPALNVTVKDVPAAGRPDSYIGAVGSFQVDATLTPTRAAVGDPVTLALSLTGEGTLDNAFAPDLLEVGNIAENFKVYEATEEGIGETRKYTYSLRPLKEGIKEFPAVPVSYFDVNQEKYVTLQTDPIPMKVSKADKLSSHQIIGSRGSAGGSNVEVKMEGLFANDTDLSALRDETIRPLRWLVGLGGMALAYVALLGIVALVRRRNGNVALQRRQSGVSRARGRLRDGKAQLKSNRLREGADHVQAALIGLVADMTDSPEAGMTPRDVEHRLETSGVAGDLRQRVHGILQACDGARYGAADNGVARAAKETEGLLKPLAAQLKSKKRF